MKKWIIRQLVKWMSPRLRFIWHDAALWRHAEAAGYHVTPVHFYQPIPNTGDLDAIYRARSETIGINWEMESQCRLLRQVFPKYAQEYNDFIAGFRADKRFGDKTLEFIGHDPNVYHCMIRHFQPGTVIEIGAGFSTHVAANAARLNKRAKIIAVDPFPSDLLLALQGEVQLLRQSAQNLDFSFFDSLGENDILFIDSSHVVKLGSDVCYLVLEILPRLKSGVLVHFHDIFLPDEYPRPMMERRRMFWNEQYLVQAYLTHNQRAKIVFANRFMYNHYPREMIEVFGKRMGTGGGSLWLQM